MSLGLGRETPGDQKAAAFLVRGVVQGVGFRPFVYRVANRLGLRGRVSNGGHGVLILVEGTQEAIECFAQCLHDEAPPASHIAGLDCLEVEHQGLPDFRIVDDGNRKGSQVTALICPDLATCPTCLRALRDPDDRRFGYPYIVCTDCGPRYSILLGLPYDRARTTMRDWPLCPACDREYRDPTDRHFHAQPTACSRCGPHYQWIEQGVSIRGDDEAIARTVNALKAGKIVAIKGLGGYHLACDARNLAAVNTLRSRKYRKEKPFALLASNLETARRLIALSPVSEEMLISPARPIVLGNAREPWPAVSPENGDLGVMLPSTPLHALLFDGGAPDVLVMTSGNRSSEPIAVEDDEAARRLSDIADAFLVGERPIARRVEDSIVRDGALGPMILRRARGYAPSVAATIPTDRPILGVGADLKNSITLVVAGQAIVGPHLGDLEFAEAEKASHDAMGDLLKLYGLDWSEVCIVHDLHPHYRSTREARRLPARGILGVQHHRAHLASVLAERGEWHRRVVGVCCDGTGFGDDGAIWGGEVFVGSVAGGFDRVMHLRTVPLPGGDASARWPVMAAAGFLAMMEDQTTLEGSPFRFPERYREALKLVGRGIRCFPTSSFGRLFDTIAALVGFLGENTFEGQAAIWLEHRARECNDREIDPYPMPIDPGTLDFLPLLRAVIRDRLDGQAPGRIARSAHLGIARALAGAIERCCNRHQIDTVVLSGGVFQNDLLLGMVREETPKGVKLWTNRVVPPNDGGISLGQVALGAFADWGGVTG